MTPQKILRALYAGEISLEEAKDALRTDANPSATALGRREAIAIVGMSGRYPDAKNLAEYWDNLIQGKNAIREIPPTRFDVSNYYDPNPATDGKIYCKWLGALDDIEYFDPLFFHIAPADADAIDPQHRLFLEEGYKAFEDAGYSPQLLSNRKCGVYLGLMSHEYDLLLHQHNLLEINLLGTGSAIAAARIAYLLNLKGPAICIDTACSSSLVATHLACQALTSQEIDMALVGGVSLYLTLGSYVGMCSAGMLSPDGQCKAFDASANGFVPGEGAGALVLKRLADAEADHDQIYGVIIGSGMNQDGATNGITAPSAKSQIDLEREIYERYQIDPASISYVEMHGTGTNLGDPIELEALATVFQEKTQRKQYCAIGSVKSNVGHTSAAAGVASVQKVLLAIKQKKLVPTLHFQQPNAHFDFATSPFYVNTEVQDWHTAEAGTPRRAAVSAFGLSGTNAHLVIEEYIPERQSDCRDVDGPCPETPSLFVLSAKSEKQLKSYAQDMKSWIQAHSELALADIAFTLQLGRAAMDHRLAIVADSREVLLQRLEGFTNNQALAEIYTGNGVTLFEADEDVQSLLRIWCQKKKLTKIAQAWVKGANVDWELLYTVGAGLAPAWPQRVSLPTYPFAKERHWCTQLPYPQTVSTPERVGRGLAPVPTRFSTVSPYSHGIGASSDSSALETLMLQPCWREEAICHEAFLPNYEKHLIMLCEPDELSARLAKQHIVDQMNGVDCLILQADQPDIDKRFQEYVTQAFWHIKNIIVNKPRGRVLIQIVVPHQEEQQPLAGLSGLLASAQRENPKLSGQLIELAADTQDIAEKLQENSCYPGSQKVRYRDDKRWVADWCEVEDTHTEEKCPWKDGGVYLITGGAGGLGLIFAHEIANRVQGATLVLTGRSMPTAEKQAQIKQLCTRLQYPQAGRERTLTPTASPKEKYTDQILTNQVEMHQGTRVIYEQVDVTQRQAVFGLIRRIQQDYGHLDGIIHSAGVLHDNFILKKTQDEIEQVLAPKVTGLVNLDQASKDVPLDFFLLFSSISGAFGKVGQADYSAANAFMDGYARYRNSLVASKQRQGETLSINWPWWKDGGMSIDVETAKVLAENIGMVAMETQTGIQALYRGLALAKDQVLIFQGNPAKMKEYRNGQTAKTLPSPETVAHLQVVPDNLREKVIQQLKVQFSAITKLSVAQLATHEPLENYGIDSTKIIQLNQRLAGIFGELSKTLFFEYRTLEELAAYFVEDHQQACIQWIGLKGNERVGTGVNPVHSTPQTPLSLGSTRTGVNSVPTRSSNGQLEQEPIAIIGIAGRYPQARKLKDYWQNLKAGWDCITEIPPERWPLEGFYHADFHEAIEQGKSYSKWGGFVEGFADFDPLFFHMSPREALSLDPQERLFIETCWEALEDAGYTSEQLARQCNRKVGVFAGITQTGFNLYGPALWKQGKSMDQPQSLHPYSSFSSVANRVSYLLNLQGPSMPIDTMCSSSLTAIHEAVEHIHRGECQMALAGGVNLYLHPSNYIGLCAHKMLSVDGQCKSFGEGGNGFVPGEGVGVVLLKRLSRAIVDHDQIYAVIRATGINHSGATNGYTVPNPTAQGELIRTTLDKAGVHARTVSYIEAHGTGTELGDPIEMTGLTQAFHKDTQETGFCSLGSVKSNIGHLEAAAGIAGVTKILLQMKHQQIVPSLHTSTLNPHINFAQTPFLVQQKLADWKRPQIEINGETRAYHRIAGISSFGAGGANAHVVLEEYVPDTHQQSVVVVDAHNPAIVVLSARNEEQLKQLVQQLLEEIADQQCSDENLANIAYTLQVGREAMEERLAVIAESIKQLAEKLGQFVEDRDGIDGVFRGTVKHSKEVMRVVSTDEDIQKAIETWVAKRKYHKLLDLWVKGLAFDWNKLYGDNKPYRISLPTYPFAREHLWITSQYRSNNEMAPDPSIGVGGDVEQGGGIGRPHSPSTTNASKPQSISLQPPSSAPFIGSSLELSRRGWGSQTDPTSPSTMTQSTYQKARIQAPGLPELEEELTRSLAQILLMEQKAIDVEKPFIEIGLDSMIDVEWIQSLNEQYGLSLPTTKVYDHPTIRQLASFLQKELLKSRSVDDRDLDTSRPLQSPLRSNEETRPTYQRVIIERPGKIDDITINEAIIPELKEKEICIAVHAFSLNFGDLLCVKGLYPTMPPYPFTPGFEASGVVLNVGRVVTAFKIGDPVIALAGPLLGGHANALICLEEHVFHKPATLSFEEACALPVVAITMIAAFEKARLKRGEKILIQTATSGTGLIAIQLANHYGGQIYATAGSQPKLDYLKQLGVPYRINYQATDFEQEIRRMTEGQGVDVVINTLPGDAIQKGMNCLSPGGRYIEIAMTALKSARTIDLSVLSHNQTFYSVDLRRLAQTDPATLKLYCHQMLQLVEERIITPTICQVFDWERLKDAYRYMENRQHIGKVVVRIPQSYRGRGSGEVGWGESETDPGSPSIPLGLEASQIPTHARPVCPPSPSILSDQSLKQKDQTTQDAIAIIGMSGQFPRAKSLSEFWDNLAQGVDCISEVPTTRWSIDTYYDADPKALRKSHSKWMGVLEDADKFDPFFFKISPGEAEYMDPQQRVFLESCWHCIEDAGLLPSALSGSRCSVFVGCITNDYGHFVFEQGLNAHGLMGHATSILSSRIAYLLNLKGAALAIDTSCSSSLVAIAEACNSLVLRNSDLALAGGVCVIPGPSLHVTTSQAGTLSPNGRCSTFDRGANGLVPGEGVGVVLLKRLSDAVRDGDPIHGVIRGWGTNQDGKTNGITAPSADAQTLLEQEVYQRFGINPATISLIEAHGTATRLGDPIEVEALTKAFQSGEQGVETRRERGADPGSPATPLSPTDKPKYCALGSVKSNIGHLMNAAGIAGVIKVLLALKHQMLPPTINFTELNEHISLDNTPFYINTQLQSWEVAPGTPRRAAVTALGFSGTNAHLVIEEYVPETNLHYPDNAIVFTLSAKSEEQLKTYAERMRSWIASHSEPFHLADLAYTLQIGREAMDFRLAFPARSREDLLKALEGFIHQNPPMGVFTGQVRKNTEQPRTFQEDEDAQSLLQSWLEKGKLAQIAELWVNGFHIDWQKIYADRRPRRINLPTYPFARESYWILPPRSESKTETAIPSTSQGLMSEKPLPVSGQPSRSDIGKPDEILAFTTSYLVNTISTVLKIRPEKLDPQVRFDQYGLDSLIVQRLKAMLEEELGPIPAVTFFRYKCINDLAQYFLKEHTQPIHTLFQQRSPNNEIPPDPSVGVGGSAERGRGLGRPGPNNEITPDPPVGVGGSAERAGDLGRPLSSIIHHIQRHIPDQRAQIESLYAALDQPLQEMDEILVRLLWAQLQTSGWFTTPQTSLTELKARVGLPTCYNRWLDEIITIFAQRGYLRYDALSEQVSDPISIDSPLRIWSEWERQKIVWLANPDLKAYVVLVDATLHALPEILTGQIPATAVLFPESSLSLLEGIFQHNRLVDFFNTLLADTVIAYLSETIKIAPAARLRILEIGAGTGGTSAMIFQKLRPYQEYIQEYCYTDISQTFLWHAQQSYGPQNPYLTYKIFNVEVPLADQDISPNVFPLDPLGFGGYTFSSARPLESGSFLDPLEGTATNSYDLVIATNVFHATRNIRQTLRNTRALLKPHGLLLLNETSVKRVFLHLTFGLLADERPYEDAAMRLPGSPYLDWQTWQTVLQQAGFHRFFFPAPEADKLGQQVIVAEASNNVDEGENVGEAGAASELASPAGKLPPISLAPTSEQDIAIIGMSGHYPQADNLDTFWSNLESGRDCIVEIPLERWDYRRYYQPKDGASGKTGGMYCKWGGFLPDIDKFDPLFFHISPREARFMDPQERLFLQNVAACFEDAGYSKHLLRDESAGDGRANVGVFAGVSYNNYQLYLLKEYEKDNLTPVNSQTYSIANRISYIYNLRGPSITLDTACSSSMVAIHLACASIKSGECAMAIAGGVNLSLHPSKYTTLCAAQFASSNGHCRSFGQDGDGAVAGEGVGAVLLKPLGDALADGDHIYAVIKGTAVNNDGKTFGYSVPNPVAQTEVIRNALEMAHVDPRTISYVEAHGTGTKLGDPIEIAGLSDAFKAYTSDKQFCPIGSVKSNIGHLEAAAGISQVTKVVLQMKHKKLVPSLLHTPGLNPHIDFANTPFFVQRTLEEWKQPVLQVNGKEVFYPRRAGISSFGAGGVNVHIILEEYQAKDVKDTHRELDNQPVVIILSAEKEQNLHDYAQRLKGYMKKCLQSPDKMARLKDIAYTLQTGRDPMSYRLAFTASKHEEVLEKLEIFLNHREASEKNGLYIGYKTAEKQSRTEVTADNLATIRTSENMAELWASGQEIDWENLYQNERRLRVPLPTYPFSKERYWAGDQLQQPRTAKVGVGEEDDAEWGESETDPVPSPFLIQLCQAFEGERQEIIEKYLQDLLAKLLAFNPPDVPELHQGFFDMGMESVLTEQFRVSLEELFLINIADTVIFDCPNISELSEYIIKRIPFSIAVPSSGSRKDIDSRRPTRGKVYPPNPNESSGNVLEKLHLPQTSKQEKTPSVKHKEKDTEKEPIAIIGMGCRFPGGCHDPETFWRFLTEGSDGIIEIPKDRFRIEDFYDPDPNATGKIYLKEAGFLQENVGDFDARFFGISPREAADMDPQQRLLLEVSWEALERAGIPASQLKGTQTGVFIGTTGYEYAFLLRENFATNPYALTGCMPNIASGRIAYILGVHGPAISIDTACSSSLVAVHLACESLQRGESSLALAGGVSLMLAPDGFLSLCALNALAKDGRCKTFDADGDGYGRGEGCGVVVLKRLSDALRDNDPILAVIKGTGVNQDGPGSGLTVPNGKAQKALILKTLEVANVSPEDIGYFEVHGTGTALGDPIELQALTEVFGKDNKREKPLYVGSVKSNIGHLEVAAGIASLIKSVLCLQNQQIPPNLHLHKVNPKIRLERIPATVPQEVTLWETTGKPRIAGISSFGFSGTNAHVIVSEREDASDDTLLSSCERPWHILALSAKDKKALSQVIASYEKYFDQTSEERLENICFTASAGRSHFPYRIAFIAENMEQVKNAITAYLHGNKGEGSIEGKGRTQTHPKLAFLIHGKISPELTQSLFETQPTFQKTLRACNERLQQLANISLLENTLSGERIRNVNTTVWQDDVLSFALHFSLLKLWEAWGIRPNAVLGSQSGELVAACAAGIMDMETAFGFILEQGGVTDKAAGEKALHAPQIRVISGRTGRPVEKQEALSHQYWEAVLSRELDRKKGMQSLHSLGYTHFLQTGLIDDSDERSDLLPTSSGVQYFLSVTEVDPWRTLTNTLANLYCLGLDIDWSGFEQGYSRRKVILPTYPFQRKYFWFETSSESSRRGRGNGVAGWEESETAPDSPSTPNDNPLDGRLINSPIKTKQMEYCLNLDAVPDVKDTDGVLHVGYYLEILSRAVKQLYHTTVFRVQTIDFLMGITIPESGTTTLSLTLNTKESSEVDFSFFSHQGDGNWNKHTQGTILLNNTDPDQSVAANWRSEITSRCTDQCSGTELYHQMQERDLFAGEGVQWIEQVWSHEGEALARLRLPRSLKISHAYEMGAHPGVIDACAQLFHAALSRSMDKDMKYIVTKWEGFTHTKCSPDQEFWCHVVFQDGPHTRGQLEGRFQLFDQNGMVVAQIRNGIMKGLTKERVDAVRNYLEQAKTTERLTSESKITSHLSRLSQDQWRGYLNDYLQQVFARILKMKVDELSIDEALMDLGMDSLMGVEAKTKVEKELGIFLPLELLIVGPSIRELTESILPHPAVKPSQTEGETRDTPLPTYKMDIASWIVYRKSKPQAKVKLFCFPYGAGGGASLYRGWQAMLPDYIEICPIQLPGKENRLKEQAFTDIGRAIDVLKQVLLPELDRPYAFYGHSMGAHIAYRLAYKLWSEIDNKPAHLFVGAYSSPTILPNPFLSLIKEKFKEIGYADIPDAESLSSIAPEKRDEILIRISSTLGADIELQRLLLPTTLAELQMGRDHKMADKVICDIPITAFHGEMDDIVTASEMNAWQQLTQGPFALHTLPGDHLFLHENQDQKQLLALLAQELEKYQ